ncbi:sugar phosphate isomerase/epimerase family protein [Halobaculum roseum]|uniref:Sugar phosphate isomerase/epimerase family protein n=1 Tax=Halobaculum roseum TaxID=2175149 RepID=A0ABD5MNU3_9EURY|nr:sugar phosphate isomerase/epimerase family protein [Halobaculum roseum]QZY03639.1 sugar phosphate isomerase/epimerase [Halobaculum roseum]
MDADIGFVTQVGIDPRAAVGTAADHGYDYVEVMLDGAGSRNRLAPRREELRGALADHGVGCTVHLPFGSIDPGSPFDAVRSGAVAELEAHLDLASDLGATKATMHPTTDAWAPAHDDESVGDHIVESVRHLDAYAADRDVELVAENVPKGRFDTNRIGELLDRTDVSMCLDTGHARVDGRDDGGIAALIEERADRISHFHLNDVRTADDEHLPIGSGFVDFERLFRALPDDWTGTLSAEVFTHDAAYLGHSLDRIEESLSAAAENGETDAEGDGARRADADRDGGRRGDADRDGDTEGGE